MIKRPEAERKKENSILTIKIKGIHKESGGTYGFRRVKAQLKKEGIACGKNRVSRLMNENKIFSKLKRKYKATTYSDHNFSIALNLLKQDFTVDELNKFYLGNITYIGTDDG